MGEENGGNSYSVKPSSETSGWWVSHASRIDGAEEGRVLMELSEKALCRGRIWSQERNQLLRKIGK